MRSANSRLSVAIAATLAAGLMLLVLLAGNSGSDSEQAGPPAGSAERSSLLVRADSRSLNEVAQPQATFVEFLDFECEACRAAFPDVERLKMEYGDRVRFVIRYFPLPSHSNSVTSAVAVEAAARQGKLVEMYARMYETQPEWGEKDDSQAAVFRTFAQDLGLDMAAFDRDVADPAVKDRVLADLKDGTELGVQGTPTFFLDGERLQPESFEDLRASMDAALAG